MPAGSGIKCRLGAARGRYAGDLLAGVSVAFVLIPQSLAYAALAGMPPERGLYAAAIPLLVAAPLMSSPYLQTGPVATTSLLTFGALSTMAQPGSDRYVELGLLLALVVGATRIAIGAAHGGVIAYLMSSPMLMGFVPGAALLIVASQLPAALGAAPSDGDLVEQAASVLAHPQSWAVGAVAFSAGALIVMVGGPRLHRRFPAALAAVVAGLAVSVLVGYQGAEVGAIPVGAPPVSLDLPWSELPSLLVAGVVIAVVGFAESASIARTFAAADRRAWDHNREFVSQGAANLAAGLSGGFPVGGSFSRSALNRQAGAQTSWSGAITGLTVLALLPLTFVLEPLPRAVLAAIVIAAVVKLIRIGPMLGLWRFSRPQFAVAFVTFGCTLALAPHVEWAVLIGVGMAIAVHLWRELPVDAQTWTEGDCVHVRPRGVLWFAAAQDLQDRLVALLERTDAKRLVIHLDGLGRLDTTGALSLRTILEEAARAGLATEVVDVQARDRRLVDNVVQPARR